jgi:hypothetical protein
LENDPSPLDLTFSAEADEVDDFVIFPHLANRFALVRCHQDSSPERERRENFCHSG